jgi:hypothetical protein
MCKMLLVTRKFRLLFIFLFCFLFAMAGCRKSSPELDKASQSPNDLSSASVIANTNNLHIDEFGVDEGDAINSGFFFFDGNYIDAPYKVSRRGLAIYVNDAMIRKPIAWPPRDVRVDKDPGIPSGLTQTSTFEDIDYTDDRKNRLDSPFSRKFRYLAQHFPQEVVVKEMIKWFRRLPFVGSADREQLGSMGVRVRTKEGKERIYGLGCPPDSGWGVVRTKTREQIMQELGSFKSDFEKNL